ncbi:ZC3H18 [Lepeophtheirus salmonis]|uniref:ZC3H18 n=1 Tax=Lepeophtheirus salmonis TaxID=72036 RepID=A0A7R8CQN7_LEPSM|nr:ZC3H18 [Lepeophtheirus salmonis]CAF2860644.1 ZC3H18 [Lepeophtheirus salmonis]
MLESTRLLNLTTPRRVSTPKLSSSSLNLSTKSLYNVKLRTHQIIEGGTQMSFRKEPEEDLNLSAKTVYNQKLTNKQVMEGAEVQHESDDNDDAMEDPENMDVSNSSDSSAKSGFIPHLCLTQTEKKKNSTNNRCDSPSQELTEKDSHQNEGTALDVSRHSNSGICGPNTSINNESPHENDTNVPTTPSFGIIRPFFDSSESESEDADTLVNNNHLHSEEETNHNTSQSKILTKFNPFTFKERYGTERNNRNETLMQVVEEGAPSRRKNHRKSIFAKNSRAGRIKMSESIVSFKEGFEYFSRFCPFELTKKAKEEFFKICEELISDILKRVSDEAFFDGGRTKVSLKDVKNVMIQYKCFPPTPKDVRYPNQHLYAFLIKNCDDQAAKLLIPPSSFELKKNEFPVDIWEDVDEEIPTTHRKKDFDPKKTPHYPREDIQSFTKYDMSWCDNYYSWREESYNNYYEQRQLQFHPQSYPRKCEPYSFRNGNNHSKKRPNRVRSSNKKEQGPISKESEDTLRTRIRNETQFQEERDKERQDLVKDKVKELQRKLTTAPLDSQQNHDNPKENTDTLSASSIPSITTEQPSSSSRPISN